jgi:hypothetical protein
MFLKTPVLEYSPTLFIFLVRSFLIGSDSKLPPVAYNVRPKNLLFLFLIPVELNDTP